MSIVTPAEVKTYLGRSDSVTDKDLALLTMLQPMVEEEVKKLFDGRIEQATHTNFLPEAPLTPTRDPFIDVVGNRVLMAPGRSGTSVLQVPQLPLRSITTIHEDSSRLFASGTLLTAGVDEDYYVDEIESGLSETGFIIRNGAWPSGRRTVKVVYVGGFTAVELRGRWGDIAYATLAAIAKAFNESKTQHGGLAGGGALASRKLGDAAVTYSTEGVENRSLAISLPAITREIILRYKPLRYF